MKLTALLCVALACTRAQGQPATAPGPIPMHQWTLLRRDGAGARRGSAVRHAAAARAFFLWGFMDADPDHLQENPLMDVPEYDVVAFDVRDGRWRDHLPAARASEWSRKRPLATIASTYAGITSGSERTVLRGPTPDRDGVPRPDLNIVFDQVAYHPPSHALVYFTGGLTAAYDVVDRRWRDLGPRHTPPPVLGGSLAYDPIHDELVLFGGGHVAQPGPGGRPVGHASTWIYGFATGDWRPLSATVEPPPRMNTRLVLDERQQVLVLFGGDGQSHYLADTWLYDLHTRTWRQSRAPGPPARAGHFTVYDGRSGSVLVGGGYDRDDRTDLWSYDVAGDRWQRLAGAVPTGFYLSADVDPEERTILLVASSRAEGERTRCNVTFPARTTYGYRIDDQTFAHAVPATEVQPPVPKRPPEPAPRIDDPERRRAQQQRLRELAPNRWQLLDGPGRVAPARTWGSATFDPDRGLVLYWGGGHCGYGGSDVDAYDVATHTWRSADVTPEYPGRLWNHGVGLAGVTFRGNPWTEHGRRMYAYDPVSHRMIMAHPIRLTAGYEPAALSGLPVAHTVAPDALTPRSSIRRNTTWSYDPDGGRWQILAGAPEGVDTLVTTRHGVVGVDVNWRARMNAAGYQLPWSPATPPEPRTVHLLDVARRRWTPLARGAAGPQNTYEMTTLVYDSRRDRLLLHGAGPKRDELWAFDLATRRWKDLRPSVDAGDAPPPCGREGVYLPKQDVLLTQAGGATWVYEPGSNHWRRHDIPLVAGNGPSRAMVYDPAHDVVLLVRAAGGDDGHAEVYALRVTDETPRCGKPTGRRCSRS
jgi:hypothetical protein